MLLRRIFLAAFAPIPPTGFSGIVLAASYDPHLRCTTIFFQSNQGQMSARYSHDSSLISLPVKSSSPLPPPGNPKVTLHLEAQFLQAHDSRRKLTTLMPVPAGSELHIVYPSPSHPDLTALWSIDNRIFYTNNDYKNVYILPPTMREPLTKPRTQR